MKVRNLAIAYSFKNSYGCPEPKFWKGRSGTVACLRKEFGVPAKKRRQVLRVLREVWKCRENGEVFIGDQKNVGGRSSLIEIDREIIVLSLAKQCQGSD